MDGCKEAMRDLCKFALFCWLPNVNHQFIELAWSVEVGTALFDRHELILDIHYFNFSGAMIRVANQRDLQEDDAIPFLYFMQGAFLASREEWYWNKQKVPGGPEKPWQHL
jgi:hypothetical protein